MDAMKDVRLLESLCIDPHVGLTGMGAVAR